MQQFYNISLTEDKRQVNPYSTSRLQLLTHNTAHTGVLATSKDSFFNLNHWSQG